MGCFLCFSPLVQLLHLCPPSQCSAPDSPISALEQMGSRASYHRGVTLVCPDGCGSGSTCCCLAGPEQRAVRVLVTEQHPAEELPVCVPAVGAAQPCDEQSLSGRSCKTPFGHLG
eukprot:5351643-Amphidinium_carterae.1